MIEAMYELAVDYDTLWYIHVADPSSPAEDSLNPPGERTIPMMESWGVLDHRLVLAHALFLRDEEVELVAERGARISCNPASGMWFGDGILGHSPTLETRDQGFATEVLRVTIL